MTGFAPVPKVAYEAWLDTLARAGWAARLVPAAVACTEQVPAGVPCTEQVPVAEALDRVTAAPVVARWPSPRSDCAAMDGIAVRAADLPAGDPAGDPAGATARLAASAFEWIDTGDPMPDGTDTVVVRERLLPQADGSVIITGADGHAKHGHAKHGHAKHGHAKHGHAEHGHAKRNVRAAGEDFAAGETLVPAGRRLRPADLAAAAAGGHPTVAVARRPVVAVIPTGDEIRPVGSKLRRGEIADTNSLLLAARCRQLGAVPVVSAVVPDDPDALAAEIRRHAHQADLILLIAGSSRGRGDHAGAVLGQVGGVAVAGVAVRPGHPALLGHAKRGPGEGRGGIAPVIGLPGYPLATAVIFELFAVPMLAALQGWQRDDSTVRAVLDRDWSSPEGVEDWIPVALARDASGTLRATPGRRGSGSISQLARAAAWWPVPAPDRDFAAGTVISVMPFTAA